MQAVPVDPRDITWEDDSPAYRVYFWRSLGTPGAFESTEFELTDVEADEVLKWAQTTARPDQTYTVYAVVQHSFGPGLLRLAGTDPTVP